MSRQHLPVGRLLRFAAMPGVWLVILLLSQLGRATPAQAAPGSAGSPHGKLSIECATCHSSEAWTPTRIASSFDHAALGFNLEGVHESVECSSCHTSLVFSNVKSACADCHEDPHGSEFGLKCATCHTTRSFDERSVMAREHALTRFPLTGSHVTLDCATCHRMHESGRLNFKDTPTDCAMCHLTEYRATRQPAHEDAGFSMNCTTCHNTTQWAGASVDHNLTDFPLTGAHTAAQCNSCHGDGVFNGKSTDCSSCHNADYLASAEPPHASLGYPTDCTTCHNTTQWAGAAFDHNVNDFPLAGAHVAAQCASCHGDGVYNGKPTDCNSCHQPDYAATNSPPHQAAGFSTNCTTCHNTTQWAGATIDHNLTEFPLTGAHMATQCASCHGDGVFNGRATDCNSCHNADYLASVEPPHASLGYPTDCMTCHGTTRWEDASFNHNQSSFPLTGAHVATSCASCHGDGVYNGKPTDCNSCHQPDYAATDDPPHQAAGFSTSCTTCHSTTQWDGATIDHSLTDFPLTGAHMATQCASCHGDGVFNGRAMDCNSCHDADYLASAEPPHATLGYPMDCITCHNTTRWEDATFNHNVSDFPLTGAHVAAQCASCHGDGVYNGKPTDCNSCHQPDYAATDDPPHQAAGFSTSCATCHNTTGWAGATFNHNLSDFPLTGAHVATQCASCHGDGVFNGRAMDCNSCHDADYLASAEPPHASLGYPTDCITCHNTTRWEDATFNHNQSDFPLTGAHVATTCASCHGDGVYNGKPTDCNSCHQPDYAATNDPPHQAAGFSTSCATCHTTTRWEDATFNHNLSDFPLTGAHVATECASCHGDGVYNGKPTACNSCHQPDYAATNDPPHQAAGFSTNCTTCHNTTRWEDATFNHNLSDFPLTGAHVATQCASCHGDGVFNGRAMDCNSCHNADYLASAEPPHASLGYPTECISCHNTTRWEDASFNHNQSDFPLTGAHVATACASCHGDGVYNGKPTDCNSCHQPDYAATNDPPHQAAGFSTSCTTCHNTTQWDGATFNHNLTSFPLTGAHMATQCASCHGDGVYNGKPTDCNSCHQPDYAASDDPPHQAAGFSTSCATCHNTVEWEGATFNHNLSDFPLTGAHVATECASCHGDGVFNGRATDCNSCHNADYLASAEPPHASVGYPTECISCHNTTRWEDASFNHNQSDFPLTGAHVATACASCHGDGVYNGKPTDCNSCHQPDYAATNDPPHQAAGFSTSCTTCHNTTQWDGATVNHNLTSFPLTGAHVAAQCASCHGDGVYNGKPTACNSCHQSDYAATNDPPHQAAGFSTNCMTCHNTTRWEGATFNHNLSGFPLTGAHVAAQCASCHGDGVYNGKPTDCNSCHQSDYAATNDPPHQAAGFPTSCTTCHTTTRWEGATFNHNLSGFPLTGAHLATDCASCHGDGVYNGKPTACNSCHQSDYAATNDPPHQAAGFSTNCTTCHNTTQWEGAMFNHSLTSFPLTGAHVAAQCASCHGDGVYNGKPTDCNSCHQSDYAATNDPPHQAAGFSTNCTTCHNTTQWEGAMFNHSLTGFPLTGAHVAAQCASCHGDGVYNGKPTDCNSCHQSDYAATTDPQHQAAGFPTTCANCHNTTRWEGATFDHDAAWFPIYSGVHRGRWSACSDCHQNATNFSQFTCLSCHPHSDRNKTNGDHQGESGYQYASSACYSCHPDGRE